MSLGTGVVATLLTAVAKMVGQVNPPADTTPPRTKKADLPLTADSLLAQYRTIQSHWLSSSDREAMQQILHRHPLSRPITTAILLGSGDFCPSNTNIRGGSCNSSSATALLQLAIFLDITSHFPLHQQHMTLLAQERAYTPFSLSLLSSLGIECIPDPTAQELSGPGTFVFAPFCHADVEIVGQCVHRWPTLYLGIPMWMVLKRERETYMEHPDVEDGTARWRGQMVWELHVKRVGLVEGFERGSVGVRFPGCEVVGEDGRVMFPDAHMMVFRFVKDGVGEEGGEEALSCDVCREDGRFMFRDMLQRSWCEKSDDERRI